jgi:hypothetical protein
VARLKLAAIFLACAAPFVLAWLAYEFDWAAGSTANYGELVAPRVLSGPPFEALRGKWVLLMADAAACNAACEQKLYILRQLRRAQGKEMERVERLWLVSDGGAPRPELLAVIEGTRVARFKDAMIAPEHIYVVDPHGNLMLRFPRQPDPTRMIKDLQRLLRASRIG